jgi:hypothetical protein
MISILYRGDLEMAEEEDRQTDRLSLLFKEAAVCKRLCLKEKKDFRSLM